MNLEMSIELLAFTQLLEKIRPVKEPALYERRQYRRRNDRRTRHNRRVSHSSDLTIDTLERRREDRRNIYKDRRRRDRRALERIKNL